FVPAVGVGYEVPSGANHPHRFGILSYNVMYKKTGFRDLGRSANDICLFEQIGCYVGIILAWRTAAASALIYPQHSFWFVRLI
ncbi:MAG: hypothetical protein Q4G07_05820, partial [Oscillospiraceae bacterium]|nr:hypothetical protein [Oscillospiraceae bacterium]